MGQLNFGTPFTFTAEELKTEALGSLLGSHERSSTERYLMEK